MSNTSLKNPTVTMEELNADRRIGPEHVAVFYIQGQQFGQDVAEYYQSARSISDANVSAINYDWDFSTDSGSVTWASISQVMQDMRDFVIGRNIHAIVLAGHWPSRLSDVLHISFDDCVQQLHSSADGYCPRDTADTWNQSYNERDTFGIEIFFTDFVEEYPSTLRYSRRTPRPVNTDLTYKYINGRANAYGENYVLYHPEPWMLYPKDHETRLLANTSNKLWSWYSQSVNPQHFVTYIVTRLEVSEIDAADTANVDKLTVVKRMIDDGIAVEANNYKASVGKTLVSGTTADDYGTGIAAYGALSDNGFDMSEVYWDNLLENEKTTYFVYKSGFQFYPVYSFSLPSSTNYPGSNTSLNPDYTKTFNPISDVFMQFQGDKCYYNQDRPPVSRTDIVYKQGAIVQMGQSFGANRNVTEDCDTFFVDRTMETALGTNSSADACDSGGGNAKIISFTADINSVTTECFYIECTDGAVVNPTAAVTADNTITLYQDGVEIVGSPVTVTDNTTLMEMLVELRTNLPTGWRVKFSDKGPESRAMRAIKNGACFACGSAVEPKTIRGMNPAGWIESLLFGDCMAEALRKRLSQAAFYYDGNFMSSPNSNLNCRFYGDPLYRPFKGRM